MPHPGSYYIPVSNDGAELQGLLDDDRKKAIEDFQVPETQNALWRLAAKIEDVCSRRYTDLRDTRFYKSLGSMTTASLIFSGALSDLAVSYTLFVLRHPIWCAQSIVYNLSAYIFFSFLFRKRGINMIHKRCCAPKYFVQRALAALAYLFFSVPCALVADYSLHIYYFGREPTDFITFDLMELRKVLDVIPSLLGFMLQAYILFRKNTGVTNTPDIDPRLLSFSCATSLLSVLRVWRWLAKYSALQTEGSKFRLVRNMANLGAGAVPAVLLRQILECRNVNCTFDFSAHRESALVCIGEAVQQSTTIETLTFTNSRWIERWCDKHGAATFTKALLDRIMRNKDKLNTLTFDAALPDGVRSYLSSNLDGHATLAQVIVQDQVLALNEYLANFDSLEEILKSSWKGYFDEVRKLIEEDEFAVDKKDRKGNSPCMLAARRGHVGIVKTFLMCGHEGETGKRNYDGENALALSSHEGHLDCVRLLLIANTDPDLQFSNGKVALMIACRFLHIHVVSALLDAKARIDIKDANGDNALTYPLYFNGPGPRVDALIRLLLRYAKNLLEPGQFVDFVNHGARSQSTAAHYAAMNGHADSLKQLLQADADAQSVDSDGASLLHGAASGGYLDVAQLLLKRKPALNLQDKAGQTALMRSSGGGFVEVTRLLLEAGALINLIDNRNRTALFHAVANKSEEVIATQLTELLLDSRANIDIIDIETGNSALYSAAYAGNTGAARQLLSAGAGADVVNLTKSNLLHGLAHGGEVELLEEILNRGSDVNAINLVDDTPLTVAIRQSHAKMVKQLLLHRACPRQIITADNSPVVLAAAHGTCEILQILQEVSADLGKCDSYEFSALHNALMMERHDNASWLLEKGIAVDRLNVFGSGPLTWAAEKGKLSLVQDLLAAKARPTERESNGGNSLIYSLKYGEEYEQIALLQLEAKANPFTETSDKSAPIHLAANRCMVRVVQKLLELRASPNAQDGEGYTPLMQALQSPHNYERTVDLLLRAEADVNLEMYLGSTALHQAVFSDDASMVRKLLERKADVSPIEWSGTSFMGWSAVHFAFRFSSREVVEQLLARTLEQSGLRQEDLVQRMREQTLNHESFVMLAASNSNDRILALALDMKGDPNHSTIERRTPLMVVSEEGFGNSMHYVKMLLTHRANAALEDVGGKSALRLALASSCKDDTCRLLEESRQAQSASLVSKSKSSLVDYDSTALHDIVDVPKLRFALAQGGLDAIEALDTSGRTVLLNAVSDFRKKNDVVQILLEMRANVHAIGNRGECLLSIAIKGGASVEQVKNLVWHRAEVHSAIDDGGEPVLFQAIRSDNLEMVKYLHSHSAALHNATCSMTSALHLAQTCQLELVQWLLDQACDVNATNISGETPLHKACGTGKQWLIKLLVQKRADIHKRDSLDGTALHVASAAGHQMACMLLLECLADQHEKNLKGETPLSLASHSKTTMQCLLNTDSILPLLRPQPHKHCIALQIFYCGTRSHIDWLLRLATMQGVCLNIDEVDHEGCTALVKVCQQGQLCTAKLLLGLGADVRIPDHTGRTPLLEAVKNSSGNVGLAELLLDNTADVNASDLWGVTAFLSAVSNTDVFSIRMLMARRADPCRVRKDGKNALHLAAAGDSIACATWLLHNTKISVDEPDEARMTPFLLAVRSGSIMVAQALLKHRANLCWKDPLKRNAIAWAPSMTHALWWARKGVPIERDTENYYLLELQFPRSIHVLVDAICHWQLSAFEGAGSLGITDNRGRTPILRASTRYTTLQMLLERQADLFVRDFHGDNLLHSAVKQSSEPASISWLLSKGLPVNSQGRSGTTAIMSAAQQGHQECVRLLLGERADVNIRNDAGLTVVHHAKTLMVLQMLLEHRADLSAVDFYGRNALSFAASRGDVQVVQFLLDKLLSPVSASSDGSLPFHCAASAGHISILKMLPPFAAPDFDGWSPAMHAALNGHLPLVEAFLAGRFGGGGLSAEFAQSCNTAGSHLLSLARVQAAMKEGLKGNISRVLGQIQKLSEWNQFNHSVPLNVINGQPSLHENAVLEGSRVIISGFSIVGLPTLGKSEGKWYLEVCIFGFKNAWLGWADERYGSQWCDELDYPACWRVSLSTKILGHNSQERPWRCAPWMRQHPQRVGMAIDCDSRKLLFTVDGTWLTAFETYDSRRMMFPCIWADGAALIVHLSDLTFAPPDSSFKVYIPTSSGNSATARPSTDVTTQKPIGDGTPSTVGVTTSQGSPHDNANPKSAGKKKIFGLR